MNIFIRLIALLLVTVSCASPVIEQPGDIVLTYPAAKDSFLVHIKDLATNAGKQDTIHMVYYPDGSLKSGKQMQELITQHSTALSKKNYVFVALSHYGFFRSKWRRDFITPSVKTGNGYKGVSENY